MFNNLFETVKTTLICSIPVALIIKNVWLTERVFELVGIPTNLPDIPLETFPISIITFSEIMLIIYLYDKYIKKIDIKEKPTDIDL